MTFMGGAVARKAALVAGSDGRISVRPSGSIFGTAHDLPQRKCSEYSGVGWAPRKNRAKGRDYGSQSDADWALLGCCLGVRAARPGANADAAPSGRAIRRDVDGS